MDGEADRSNSTVADRELRASVDAFSIEVREEALSTKEPIAPSEESLRLPTQKSESQINVAWDESKVDVSNVVRILHFDENDPENPLHFKARTKWGAALLVSFSTLSITFASSEYTGAFFALMKVFNVSEEIVILGLSLMLFGFAFGPLLFWSPLSEQFGRKPVYVFSALCFFFFNLGCALAQNMATILVCRFFMGLLGSAPLSVSGGYIADLFEPAHRNAAMALFAAAPFLGPVIGPIVGGAIAVSGIDWRWTFWITTIMGGVVALFTLILPEAYAPVLLSRKAKLKSELTGLNYQSMRDIKAAETPLKKRIEELLLRPWRILFTEPIMLAISVYIAFVYGCLYLLFEAIPLVYTLARGWNLLETGLVFISLGIGSMIGILAVGVSQKLYMRQVNPVTKRAPPEARLHAAMWAAIALPISFTWFAWTCYPVSIPWPASVISLALFGFGMVGIFISLLNFSLDCYPEYTASAVAASAFLRSVVGGAFPLFATFMYDALGLNWASMLLAFVCFGLMPLPFIFYKFGWWLRSKSKMCLKDDEKFEF